MNRPFYVPVDDLICLLECKLLLMLTRDQGTLQLNKDYLVRLIAGQITLDEVEETVDSKWVSVVSHHMPLEQFKLMLLFTGRTDFKIGLVKPEDVESSPEAAIGF